MRGLILLITFVLPSACSQVQILSQDIGEGVSGVVYNITEPDVPQIQNQPTGGAVTSSLRPPPRPANLGVAVNQPNNLGQAIREIFAPKSPDPEYLDIAYSWLGKTERADRKELREFLGVDPRQTEWCAAFVNSVLEAESVPSLRTQNHRAPLLARSFLDWGEPVPYKNDDSPKPGDIVIFPRGRASWQGHVGFYIETVTVDGKDYWRILSGNSNNSVSLDLYNPNRAIGVRRMQILRTAQNFWSRFLVS